jgi:hypothetical protein
MDAVCTEHKEKGRVSYEIIRKVLLRNVLSVEISTFTL